MTSKLSVALCLALINALGLLPQVRAATIHMQEAKQPESINSASYPNLPAALAAAGTSKTLIVSTRRAISESLTVSVAHLDFSAGGAFSVDNAQAVVSIVGTSVTAPRTQIFFGPGAVQFTGAYPDEFKPEWFGARGDGVTDDSAAFEKMEAAMQYQPPGAAAFGGHVTGATGRVYFLAKPWNLNRAVFLEGIAFRAAPNTTALRVHGVSTETGKYELRNGTAAGSVFERVSVTGQAGGMTGTANVDGLVVTRLTGAAYDATVGASNVTITINGAEYIVESVAGANTLTLAAPRLSVYLNGTTTVRRDSNAPLTRDWMGQTLSVNGQTRRITSVEPDFDFGDGGFKGRLTVSAAIGGGNDHATATVSGLQATNAQTRANVFHGIDARARITLRNCIAQGFAGNGINADTTLAPSFNLATEPNTNNSQIDNVDAINNLGHGLYFRGVNANNSNIRGGDFSNNHGYGFYDNSFLGNNYYSLHASFNWRGAYYTSSGVNISQVTDAYTEAGQPSSQFGTKTTVRGGNQAAGIDLADGVPICVGVAGCPEAYAPNGGLAGGNIGEPLKLLTAADHNAQGTLVYKYYVADTTRGGFNYNLPNMTGVRPGFEVALKDRAGVAPFVITATGGAKIDGAASLTVTGYNNANAVRLLWDGENWLTLTPRK